MTWPHVFGTQYPTVSLSYLDDNFNAISTSTGAAIVGFQAAGAGAVATDLQTRGRQIVYVTDFAANGVSGAKVDQTGVTDSTLGIQAAINLFSGTGWDGSTWHNPTASGTVIFPPGSYKITSTLTYNGGPSYGITLSSDMLGSALGANLVWEGAAGGIPMKWLGACNSSIRGITFDGTQSSENVLYCLQIDSTNDASQSPGSHDNTVEKCYFKLGTTASGACIALGHATGGATPQVSEIAFKDNYFTGNSVGTAILSLTGGNTKNFHLLGGTVTTFDVGVDWRLQTNAAANSIRDTLFLSSATVDIYKNTDQMHISSLRSEGSAMLLKGNVSANPGTVSVQESYWAGTTVTNDLFIYGGDMLILMNNYFTNSRTGSSIPLIQLGFVSNSDAALGGILSIGNFYKNATQAAGNNPFQDTSGNDLFYSGGYYDLISTPVNCVSMGDKGGLVNAIVPLKNYWGPVGGPVLTEELKVAPASNNGAKFDLVPFTESLTIAAAASTDSAASIPAGSVILGVSVRVTTTIPTAATFTVTTATGGTTLDTSAVSTAAGSTDPGTAAGSFYQSSATKIRITPNLTPGAATGVVRLTGYYYSLTPATS